MSFATNSPVTDYVDSSQAAVYLDDLSVDSLGMDAGEQYRQQYRQHQQQQESEALYMNGRNLQYDHVGVQYPVVGSSDAQTWLHSPMAVQSGDYYQGHDLGMEYLVTDETYSPINDPSIEPRQRQQPPPMSSFMTPAYSTDQAFGNYSNTTAQHSQVSLPDHSNDFYNVSTDPSSADLHLMNYTTPPYPSPHQSPNVFGNANLSNSFAAPSPLAEMSTLALNHPSSQESGFMSYRKGIHSYHGSPLTPVTAPPPLPLEYPPKMRTSVSTESLISNASAAADRPTGPMFSPTFGFVLDSIQHPPDGVYNGDDIQYHGNHSLHYAFPTHRSSLPSLDQTSFARSIKNHRGKGRKSGGGGGGPSHTRTPSAPALVLSNTSQDVILSSPAVHRAPSTVDRPTKRQASAPLKRRSESLSHIEMQCSPPPGNTPVMPSPLAVIPPTVPSSVPPQAPSTPLLSFDLTQAEGLRSLVQYYLSLKQPMLNGERKLTISVGRLVQKSYGSERRFIIPCPSLRLEGSEWFAGHLMGPYFGSTSSSSPITPTTLWAQSAHKLKAAQSKASCQLARFNASVGCVGADSKFTTATGETCYLSYSGTEINLAKNPEGFVPLWMRSAMRELFVADSKGDSQDDLNDADDKLSSDRSRHISFMVDTRPKSATDSGSQSQRLGPFHSPHFDVISKVSTSKKVTNSQNPERMSPSECSIINSVVKINHGSLVAVYNRAKAQAFRTKYLGISKTDEFLSTKAQDSKPAVSLCPLKSRCFYWDSFYIWLVDVAIYQSELKNGFKNQKSLNGPPSFAKQPLSSPNEPTKVTPIHFNQPIVLQCAVTREVSPLLVLRKIEGKHTVLGCGSAQSGFNLDMFAGTMREHELVNGLQRVAFQLLSADHRSTSLALENGRYLATGDEEVEWVNGVQARSLLSTTTLRQLYGRFREQLHVDNSKAKAKKSTKSNKMKSKPANHSSPIATKLPDMIDFGPSSNSTTFDGTEFEPFQSANSSESIFPEMLDWHPQGQQDSLPVGFETSQTVGVPFQNPQVPYPTGSEEDNCVTNVNTGDAIVPDLPTGESPADVDNDTFAQWSEDVTDDCVWNIMPTGKCCRPENFESKLN